MTQERTTAIDNAMSNLIETVLIDKSRTIDEAFGMIEMAVSMNLVDEGLDDTVSPAELEYATRQFYL